jgi:hypothetical protein
MFFTERKMYSKIFCQQHLIAGTYIRGFNLGHAFCLTHLGIIFSGAVHATRPFFLFMPSTSGAQARAD